MNNKERVKFAIGVVPFLCLLATIFTALKLTGLVQMSWLWALSPLWIIPVAYVLVLLLVGPIFIVTFFLSFAVLVVKLRSLIGRPIDLKVTEEIIEV